MLNLIKAFVTDEAGAVTVDWLLLTATIVVLGAIVVAPVATDAEIMSSNIIEIEAERSEAGGCVKL
jgi:Flp pilus assembly pilin Flp